jgi:hypothetical protein
VQVVIGRTAHAAGAIPAPASDTVRAVDSCSTE